MDVTNLDLAWLQEPPDGSAPSSPVESRAQALPLAELSWQNFERLILRLVRREAATVDCAIYGTAGQAQGGIDILATHSEHPARTRCYQCKKVDAFGPARIAAAVDKFLSGKWAKTSDVFILCVSLPLTSTEQQDELNRQRTRLAERGVQLSVWDGAAAGEIHERLKANPDLVDDFFGRTWVKSFNGSVADSHLGDRLDGYELGALRRRLLALYSILFTQHDPGLRPDDERRLDYRDRYVMPEVIERIQVEAATTGRSGPNSPAAEQDPGGNAVRQELHSTSGGRLTTYEARTPAFEWLRHQRHCIVLGEPGYGKSTTLRYLALSILKPEHLQFDAIDPDYFFRLPVWLSFARFSASIEREPSTSPEDFFRTWLHQHSFDDVYPLFQRAARAGQVLLLVDGLDEAATEHAGREALDRIMTFQQSSGASIICTSRPQGYRSLGVPAAWTTATLTPLSDQKIEELATRWFSFLEGPADSRSNDGLVGRNRAQAFLRVARDSPRTLELARNPLLCQSLIQIFRFSHQLPEARTEVYKQIVELLLSKHPAARAQAGGGPAPINALGLKTADLNEILIRLAWAMQSQPGGALGRSRCEQVCAEFLMDDTYGLGELPAKARRTANDIINQLATHYGVLVERAPGEFSLLHLSIQEYLAAESVARRSSEDQLKWLSEIWTTPAWRESLLAWFGILGVRGDKPLAGDASKRLAELGEAGEWRRMQSLELRAEIATSDLGLPVSEARRIVEQAIREVETSPFVEFRTGLARSIALGSLDKPVQTECQNAIRRWLPGQTESKRRRLLGAFRAWQPSDPLRTTLIRALQDPQVMCRRAAINSFLAVFDDANTLPTLKQLATHHLQPEVRATILRGLSTRPDWADVANECAESNAETAHPDLFMAVLRIRIAGGLQNDLDINRLWTLSQGFFVESFILDELIDLLCRGWPKHARLRDFCLRTLARQSGNENIELPFVYLTRCYPGDEEVADMVVSLTQRLGRGLSLHKAAIWDEVRTGFRGHPRIAAAVRAMLHKDWAHKKRRIFWDPQSASAMAAIGDDSARNDLIGAYAAAEGPRDRYWIATALLRSWREDGAVLAQLKEWAAGDVAMAAPLASWAGLFVEDGAPRHEWLRRVARDTTSTREIDAILMLLEEVPDRETRLLAEDLLDDPNIWYYNRMTLQGMYARTFPDAPRSADILDRSLKELDGPNPGSMADVLEKNADTSKLLLAASVPAPVDVRLAVASVLRERAIDLQTLMGVTSLLLAEEDSAVRASCLIARARAARNNADSMRELIDVLIPEIEATGFHMDIRCRTALTALLELEAYSSIAATFVAQQGRGLLSRLIDWVDLDSVSISTIVDHWHKLKPLLLEHGLKADFPVADAVRRGYDGLIEREPSLQRELDEYFDSSSGELIGAFYFDAFARRHPRSASLRLLLLRVLAGGERGDVACAAARVLAAQFSSTQDIWPELVSSLGAPQTAAAQLADGVLGHLALGWPEGELATWVGDMSSDERKRLPVRDRLLLGVFLKDTAQSEAAARELLAEPLESWEYRGEDSHALRLWAQSDCAESTLVRWLDSDTPTLSITAVSLMARARRGLDMHVEPLVKRFDAQCALRDVAPMDGLDAVTGRQTSWAAAIYSALRAWPGMAA